MEGMQVVKRIARTLTIVIFALCLPLFLVTAAITFTFGTPETLKNALHETEVYDRFVDNTFAALQQADEEDQEEPEQGSVPIDNQIVRDAVDAAFPPPLLRQSAEAIIDGIYRWLAGEVERPDFRVDLTDAKQTLAQSLADQSLKRLEGLPVCSADQLAEVDVQDFDPFNVPCRPPGLDLTAKHHEFLTEVADSQELLPNPVITADTFVSEDEQDPFENERLPTIFQWSRRLPWIFAAITVLSGALALGISPHRRRTTRTIAKILLIIGLISFVGSVLIALVLGNVKPGEGNSPSDVQGLAFGLVLHLLAALSRTAALISGIYTTVGTSGLLALHLTRPQNNTSAKTTSKSSK